jgi:cystine transport system substrate-binding protein
VRAFPLLCAIFLLVATAAGVTAARAGQSGSLRAEAESLEQQSATLAEAAGQALHELYALETSLGRAERRATGLHSQVEQLESEQAAARRRLQIARQAERIAQRQLADRLTALYVEGDPDPFEILLGASSLDDVLSAFDGLSRLAAEDERIASQARETGASLHTALQELAAQEESVRAAVAEAELARRWLAAARDEKATYVAALEREQELNAGQIAELTALAAEAEATTAELQSSAGAAEPPLVEPDPAPTVPASPSVQSASPAPGGRSLTVDAVAYSLPGFTASGLPVGKGVVAVDPSVIPLGTRMFVPGYGQAIAADVGSAIKGLIIDLWFPTYEQAAAWGRKTVTITLYTQ